MIFFKEIPHKYSAKYESRFGAKSLGGICAVLLNFAMTQNQFTLKGMINKMKKTKGMRLISLMLAILMVTSLFTVTGVTANAEGTSQMVFTYEDKTFTVDIGGTLSPENMAYVLKDHSVVKIVEAYSSNSDYFEVRNGFNEQEIVAKKPFTGTEQLTLDLFNGSETYF